MFAKQVKAMSDLSKVNMLVQRVLARAATPEGVTKSAALKSSHMKAKDFDRVLDKMLEEKLITVSVEYRGTTKPAIVIRAAEKS